jgi:hypothetical protein
MAKKNESAKKDSATGKYVNKGEQKKKTALNEQKKRDTDDTGPRDKR